MYWMSDFALEVQLCREEGGCESCGNKNPTPFVFTPRKKNGEAPKSKGSLAQIMKWKRIETNHRLRRRGKVNESLQ